MLTLLLLFPFLSFADVLRDDVATTEKLSYSFKEVCQKMVTHESPLIEALSATELDCMGKKVSVASFCEKETAADPYYLRAYVNKTTNQVVCHSGKTVNFKLQCVKFEEHKFCEAKALASCQVLKEKLAKRLDIVHSSITKNEKGVKELNCYFESLPLKERLIDSL